MNYDTFIEGLTYYYQLYDKGLKKQANKYIEEYTRSISALDEQDRKDLLFLFARELCDDDKHDLTKLKKRGNGRLPYVLDTLLRDYLYSECLENKMPQLRWYYELYWNDSIGAMYAAEMLEKAYLSDERDKKTVELLFDLWIDLLGWGAHHFPDGCIITKEAVSNAVSQCKKIISENKVEEKFIEKLRYYEALYQCFYKYEAEGRSKSFQEYCKEAQIIF